MRVLLYASVVLATVLLFVVQPLVAGYLLPWFVGALLARRRAGAS